MLQVGRASGEIGGHCARSLPHFGSCAPGLPRLSKRSESSLPPLVPHRPMCAQSTLHRLSIHALTRVLFSIAPLGSCSSSVDERMVRQERRTPANAVPLLPVQRSRSACRHSCLSFGAALNRSEAHRRSSRHASAGRALDDAPAVWRGATGVWSGNAPVDHFRRVAQASVACGSLAPPPPMLEIRHVGVHRYSAVAYAARPSHPCAASGGLPPFHIGRPRQRAATVDGLAVRTMFGLDRFDALVPDWAASCLKATASHSCACACQRAVDMHTGWNGVQDVVHRLGDSDF